MEQSPPNYLEAIGFNNLSNNVVYNNLTKNIFYPNLSDLQTRIKVKRENYRVFLRHDYSQIPEEYRRDIKAYGKLLGINLRKKPKFLKLVISFILEDIPVTWSDRAAVKP